MVCMKDKNSVHRPNEYIILFVGLAGRTKHHAHKVTRVAEIVLRVNKGLTDAVLIRHGHQCRHLGDQTDGRNILLFR